MFAIAVVFNLHESSVILFGILGNYLCLYIRENFSKILGK